MRRVGVAEVEVVKTYVRRVVVMGAIQLTVPPGVVSEGVATMVLKKHSRTGPKVESRLGRVLPKKFLVRWERAALPLCVGLQLQMLWPLWVRLV